MPARNTNNTQAECHTELSKQGRTSLKIIQTSKKRLEFRQPRPDLRSRREERALHPTRRCHLIVQAVSIALPPFPKDASRGNVPRSRSCWTVGVYLSAMPR